MKMLLRSTSRYAIFTFLGCLAIERVNSQTIETPMPAFYLKAACTEETSENATGFCDGAIEAFYSVMGGWCVPSRVTHGDVKRLVKLRLRNTDFPAGQFPPAAAADFVWETIAANWPCK